MFGLFSSTPNNLGVKDGKLAPCPTSPNCVCSQAGDESHHVAPLTYKGSGTDALSHLKSVLRHLPRVHIVTETPTYLHAEFTTLIFRFVDDVEFLVDEKTREIHCRSASRAGYSDLGVNRRRIDQIRRLFTSTV